jgi:hypothetical protein
MRTRIPIPGVELDINSEEDSRGERGAAWSGGADTTSAAAKKNRTKGFG